MPLQLGLVGLPNVGKSTLFNALTHAGADVASYPFTTIDPNIGIVPVPDKRLEQLQALIQPEKTVPTTLEVVDIAGLVRGASKGEGLGNQFLSHIRTVDAIAMVVRCFIDDTIPHVTETLDPVGDAETIELELAMADIDVLERFRESVLTRSKGKPRDYVDQLETIDLAIETLKGGTLLRTLALSDTQDTHLAEAALLTNKPFFYVANVSESDLPEGGPLAEALKKHAQAGGAETVAVCAALENEISEFGAEEASSFLQAYGVSEMGLNRFISTGYRLLSYITFFTTTGGKEVRAWNIIRGTTILEAAGKIHTDMARGFIRAEVVPCETLVTAGSMAQVRESGSLRIEGRDYIVQDGDVIHVRFNV